MEDQEFGAERDAYNRVGKGRAVDEYLDADLSELNGKKKIYAGAERFLKRLDDCFRELEENHIMEEGDNEPILSLTKLASGLEYKNPLGFVLGYLANAKNMDSEYMTELSNLALCKDFAVHYFDIIRYARYINYLQGG